MGGIGYALGSIFSGAGEGLAAQANADIQTRREIALENLRNQNAQSLERIKSQDNMAENNNSAANQDTLDAHKQARKFGYDTATNEQQQGFQQQNIILRGKVDLQNDTALAEVQHKYHLDEQQAHDMREIAAQAQRDSTLIDHFAVDTNGHIVGYTKTGKAYQSNTDSFIPTGQSVSVTGDSSGGDGTISGELANRGGGGTSSPAPSSAPKPRNGTGGNGDNSALAQLAKLPPPGPGQARTATGPNGLRAHWNGVRWVLDDVNGG